MQKGLTLFLVGIFILSFSIPSFLFAQEKKKEQKEVWVFYDLGWPNDKEFAIYKYEDGKKTEVKRYDGEKYTGKLKEHKESEKPWWQIYKKVVKAGKASLGVRVGNYKPYKKKK